MPASSARRSDDRERSLSPLSKVGHAATDPPTPTALPAATPTPPAPAAAAAAAAAQLAGAVEPTTTGAPLAIFKKLEAQFRLPPRVTAYMLDVLQLENLDDFIHLFNDPGEVAGIVTDMVPGLTNKPLATARIRQAWTGVKSAQAQEEVIKKKASEVDDFDELLPQPQLEDIGERFWTRYHLRHPADVEPSDLLVSRLYKELTKRQLTVRSVWQTRTMTHQLRTDRKRRKIAENLEFIEREAPVEVVHNVNTYLELLFTLCVAYAKAGVGPVEGTTAPEARTSDPADYVIAPLETMLRYHHRAVTCARALPPAAALPWLQKRDEDERTLWVERYRATAQPFGRIVQDAYERREAVWDLPQAIGGATRQTQLAIQGDPTAAASTQQQGAHGGAKPTCPAFQRGTCREPCPQGKAHVCAAMLNTGRICGLKNHGASTCKNRRKAKALSV